MKDLIQKVKDLVQKLCLKVKAEWPSFKRLIDLVVRLVTKKIPKEELPSAKTEAVSLLSQTKTILTLGGIGVVLVLLIVLRSCSSSADDVRNEILAKHMEEMNRQRKEQERARKEAIEESHRQALEQEKVIQRNKSILAVNAWCEQELKKLEAEKIEARKEILRTLKSPHQIIKERDWPQIRFAALSNLTLAEPLPPELKEFADGVTLPLKEKFLGVFTSLTIGLRRCDLHDLPRLVESVSLGGRVSGTTKEELRVVRDRLLSELNSILGSKGKFKSGDEVYNELYVSWKGLPEWEASLELVEKGWGEPGGAVSFNVSGGDFLSLVMNRIQEEFNAQEERLEAEFAAKAEAIKKESLKKIEAINKNKGEN